MSISRFEFRVWGDDLDDAARRLDQIGRRFDIRKGDETYLLVRGNDTVNPKIRHSTLDVKALVDTVDGFERWTPELEAPFPLTAQWIGDELLPTLGIAPPLLDRPAYAERDFVAHVADPHPRIGVIPVSKQRVMYEAAGCLGEASAVTIAGIETRTVAIESTDLEMLATLRDTLGLDQRENWSYPRAIRRLVGTT